MRPAPAAPGERTLEQEVVDASRRLGLQLVRSSPTHALFFIGEVEVTISFDALARLWPQTPVAQRPKMVEDFLRAMNTVPTNVGASNLDQVRDRIIVRVAQSNYANIPGLPAQAIPPKWDIVPGHLSVFIAVDDEQTVSTATQGNFDEWGLSFEQAYEIGIENLRRRTNPRRQGAFKPFPAVRFYNDGDAYDASRALLLGDLVQPWPAYGVVFGVPTRDHFFWSVVDGSKTLEALNVMLQLNQKFLQEGAKPITDQLFWFDGTAWELIGVQWTNRGPVPAPPSPRLRAALMARP